MTFFGFHEISWDIRKTLETCEDYSCAHDHLASDAITSFGYIIIAGTGKNEGAIISRKRIGSVHEDKLSDSKWFLVQTNNDHWDSGCNYRCENAVENLK